VRGGIVGDLKDSLVNYWELDGVVIFCMCINHT